MGRKATMKELKTAIDAVMQRDISFISDLSNDKNPQVQKLVDAAGTRLRLLQDITDFIHGDRVQLNIRGEKR